MGNKKKKTGQAVWLSSENNRKIINFRAQLATYRSSFKEDDCKDMNVKPNEVVDYLFLVYQTLVDKLREKDQEEDREKEMINLMTFFEKIQVPAISIDK